MQSELVSDSTSARPATSLELRAGSAGSDPESPTQAAPIKTADVFTAREVLRLRMSMDLRADQDPAAEYYWAELLQDCADADVFEAAWDHYRSRSRPLWPADTLEWARIESQHRHDAAVEQRKLELDERTGSGWVAAAFAMWTQIFDREIALGASPQSSAKAADSMAYS